MHPLTRMGPVVNRNSQAATFVDDREDCRRARPASFGRTRTNQWLMDAGDRHAWTESLRYQMRRTPSESSLASELITGMSIAKA